VSQEPSKESKLTVAQAAALVKVKTAEVLSFRDYGDYVVVVTTAGQKLRGDKK
jgi:DNA-binding LytR/AlgR family response regulator